MIIKSFEERKIRDSTASFILIYGKNDGLKKKIIDEDIVKNKEISIEKFEENEIINTSDNFIASLLTKSFFQKKRYILISRTSEKILKIVQEILDKKIEDITIIINCSVLDKKSKLRNFFDKEKKVVCIPVYNDENNTLSLIVNNFFKKYKIPISQETINLLVERCAGDRQNLNNELEKISLFLKSKDKIDLEDILTLSNLSENYEISDLADNCLSKNTKKITKILNENNFNDEDCILIIRTIISKSKRLRLLHEELKINNDINQIILKFKPPIFWKDKEIVKKQIQKWSLRDIENFIYKLSELELSVKKNYNSSLNLMSNFIIENSV